MEKSFYMTVFVTMLMIVFDKSYSDGNVLMLPLPTFSASYRTAFLARELTEHGYNATVVFPKGKVRDRITAEVDLNVIVSEGMTKSLEVIDEISNIVVGSALNGSKWGLTSVTQIEQVCYNIAQDQDLLKILQETKFSIAIINMGMLNLCASVIPYKLSIPFIREEILSLNMRNLIHPAVFPASFLLPFSDKMTYFERVANTMTVLVWLIIPDLFNPSDVAGKFASDKKYISNEELQAKTELFLLDYDELLDYHVPLYPNMILVGGLATRPPRQLKGKLKLFMDSAVDGAVIMSFGSIIQWIPDITRNIMLETFRQLPNLKFVFKYGNETSIDDNVMFLPWIPQNDVLGHQNAKLFITHCGKNAQFDALYNAVPVVALPVNGDQHYNAMQMEAKGYGIRLNILNMTPRMLNTAINTVINTPSYKQNIAKASAIFKGRQYTPAQRAAWWTEHVIKYGGNHLRPPVATIPYHQFLMVDVIVSILALFACLILTCYFSTKCLFRMFWKVVRKRKTA